VNILFCMIPLMAVAWGLIFWLIGLLFLTALIVFFFLVQKQDKEKRLEFLKTRKYEFGVLIAQNGPVSGETFPVVRSGLTIGREPTTCDVVLAGTNVSREHARIFLMGDRPVLADLHSKNGTFVNGEFVIQHELKDGDEILLGQKTPIAFTYKIQ